jgi:tripartite-type tricarboxylate transporter receptor subunit TctC
MAWSCTFCSQPWGDSLPARPKAWRTTATTALALCAVLVASGVAAKDAAQNAPTFPSRAVRLIVPLPPGSNPDVRSRHIAQKLSEEWGQPVVVENRAGASGAIAIEHVVRSEPDGHTLLMAHLGMLALLPHLRRLSFDPLKDLVPVTQVSAGPPVLVLNPAVPAGSLQELIAYAKANPGKLSAASGGEGGPSHMALLLFNKATGLNITHVPYKGGTQVTADLLSGQVQATFDFANIVGPHIKAGRMKPIAVTGETRLAVLPDVPTFQELGYPAVKMTSWQGITVAAGTPPEIVRTLNAALVKVLQSPEIRDGIVSTGAEVGGNSPDEFSAFIRAEHARWGTLIREAGIRLD